LTIKGKEENPFFPSGKRERRGFSRQQLSPPSYEAPKQTGGGGKRGKGGFEFPPERKGANVNLLKDRRKRSSSEGRPK